MPISGLAIGIVLLGLALPAQLSAQRTEPEVALALEAPFAEWCDALACQSKHDPFGVLPRFADGGRAGKSKPYEPSALEKQLLGLLGKRVESLVSSGETWASARATRDFLDALLSMLRAGDYSQAQVRSATEAAFRAGLVGLLYARLPADPGCGGAPRMDAIYEGLALSVVFSPLTFTHAKRSAASECVATAYAAQRAADAALLEVMAADLVHGAALSLRAVASACPGSLEVSASLGSLHDGTATLLSLESVASLAQAGQLNTPELAECARVASAQSELTRLLAADARTLALIEVPLEPLAQSLQQDARLAITELLRARRRVGAGVAAIIAEARNLAADADAATALLYDLALTALERTVRTAAAGAIEQVPSEVVEALLASLRARADALVVSMLPATTPEASFERAGAFQSLCVPPLCGAPTGSQVDSVTRDLSSRFAGGIAEQEVQRRIVEAARAQLEERLGSSYSRPIHDVALALTSAVEADARAWRAAGGLAGPLLRLSLVAALDGSVPAVSGCEGAARWNAVYEGLASSVILSRLPFPQARGTVAGACVPLARDVQREVDSWLLAGVVDVRWLAQAGSVASALVTMRQACVADPAALALGYLASKAGDSITGLGAQRAALQAALGSVSGSCAVEVRKVLALAPPSAPDALTGQILELPTEHLLELSRLVPEACQSEGCRQLGKRIVSLMLQQPPATEDVRALLDEAITLLAESAGSDAKVVALVLHALVRAIVVVDGHVGVDPAKFIEELVASSCVTEAGLDLACLAGFQDSPWVVQGAIGWPLLKSKEFRLSGDATLGYRATKWHVIAAGSAIHYDSEAGRTNVDVNNFRAEVDGGYHSGDAASRVGIEVLVLGAFDLYDTTTILDDETEAYPVVDYDSLILQGSGLLGLWLEPSSKFLVKLHAGGGVQWEAFDETFSNLDVGQTLDSISQVSARANARLFARWRAFPGVLAFRLRSRMGYFSITRETLSYRSSTGSVSVSVDTQKQMETRTRLFADLDALRFFDFVPAAFVGLEFISVGDETQRIVSYTPLFGVGLVRGVE